jgi:hypothetical protein
LWGLFRGETFFARRKADAEPKKAFFAELAEPHDGGHQSTVDDRTKRKGLPKKPNLNERDPDRGDASYPKPILLRA